MTTSQIAVCIGCGCDDNHACYAGCYWLRVDYTDRKGVCSECEEHVEAWDRDDRTSHAESAELVENPPRIPRPEQPRPPGIVPVPDCEVIAFGNAAISFMRAPKPCPHDWPFEDVEDTDCCRWCGMTFFRHIYTEMP